MPLIHTCYRITDIDRSVAFYEALGFEEIGAHPDPRRGDQRLHEPARRRRHAAAGADLQLRRRLAYEIGTGYGHIAITADDLDGTLARLAEQGIEPEKPPYTVREGGSRLCFVRDPDGYRQSPLLSLHSPIRGVAD